MWIRQVSWLAVLVLAVAAGADAVTLVEQGRARSVIVAARDDPPAVQFAVKDLQTYVEKATGAKLPIQDSPAAPDGTARILVGAGAARAAGVALPEFRPEEFLIRVQGDTVVLAGQDSAGAPTHHYTRTGTTFAVATFLSRYLGVRWLWPGESGEVVPRRASLAVPDGEIRDAPDFPYRWFWYTFRNDGRSLAEFGAWRKHNLLSVQLRGHSGHSFSRHMAKVKFEEHPEYFALVGGKRRPIAKGRQVCTSNPDVARIFAENIHQWTGRDIYSISPNDGGGFCECERCRALDVRLPTDPAGALIITDRIFTFANQVARLAAKTDPDKLLGLYAYTYFRTPPRRLKAIEPNIVLFFTMACHWYRTPEVRAEYRGMMDAWGKLVKRIIAREYHGLIYWLSLPNVHTRLIAQEIPWLKARHVIGINSEMERNFATHGVNYYLAARLLWDADADPGAVLDDYYRSGWGPAADEVRAYFDTFETALEKRVRNREGMGRRTTYSALPVLFSEDVFQEANRHLTRAYERADTDEVRKRLDFIKIGYDYSRMTARLIELWRRLCAVGAGFQLISPWPGAASATEEQAGQWIDEAVRLVNQRRALLEKTKDLPALHYSGLTDKRTTSAWEQETKRLKGTMKLVKKSGQRLDDPWKFALDPREVGERKGWMKPDFDDSKWQDIKTSTFWEDQGHPAYNGAAWYRLRFRVPDEHKGQKARIRFGAIDESHKFWLNGKKVGEFFFDVDKDPDSWKKPVTYDVTGLLRFGAENVAAVMVIDRSGMGGIWKNVYLIWGDEPRNLIANADFSQGLEGWRIAGSGKRSAELLHDGGTEGGPCVHVRVLEHGALASLNYSIPSVTEGRTYRLTVRARAAGCRPDPKRKHLRALNMRVIFCDEKGKSVTDTRGYYWTSMRAEALADWRKFHRTFVARPGTRKATLTIFTSLAGEYWIERVQVAEVKAE